jgi:hypothetical protein
MKLVLTFKDGATETVEADSGKLDFRAIRNADTISYWDERAVYLSELSSVEISGHPEPQPEVPLKTQQYETSPARFFGGEVLVQHTTDPAQLKSTTLTTRKAGK